MTDVGRDTNPLRWRQQLFTFDGAVYRRFEGTGPTFDGVSFNYYPEQGGYVAAFLYLDNGYAANCRFRDPEFAALVKSCPDVSPLIDWVVEHAATDDQRRFAAAVQDLIAA